MSPKYDINFDTKVIVVLDQTLTYDELIGELIKEGHGDILEEVRWIIDNKDKQLLRDSGWVEK